MCEDSKGPPPFFFPNTDSYRVVHLAPLDTASIIAKVILVLGSTDCLCRIYAMGILNQILE